MMPVASSPLPSSSPNDELLVASERRRTSDGIKKGNRSVRITKLSEDEQQRASSRMSSATVMDPSVFVHAGTTGIRHLLPIHLHEPNFSRSIVRIRARTPKSSRSTCTNADTIRQICSTIQTLKQFDVSDNTLEDLPIELSRLIELEKLNCANNRLTTLSNDFEQLRNLKDLNLSFNSFKRLPAVIATFSKLAKLNVEENALKMIDVPFTNLRLLKTLVLDKNQLQSIDMIDFQHLTSLESLHIAQNQLTKFPRNLQRLKHLKIVDLSSNQLTSFPIELFLIDSLDVLNLSHNRIRKLSPFNDVYKRKTLLFSIDLSHNQLIKFYDFLLFICRKLDLSHNQIQSIPSNVLDKFTEEMLNERELKLYQNPLINTKAPADLRNEIHNVLPFIHQFFHELHNTEIVRQGFRICVIGVKNSGKSALTYSLQENLPFIPDDDDDDELNSKTQRIVDVHQFSFSIDEIQPNHSSTPTKAREPIRKLHEKRQMAKTPTLSTKSPEPPHRSLPVTIFDFTGELNLFSNVSPFLRNNGIYLICVHSIEFYRQTPKDIDELFNEKTSIDRSSMIGQLFELIQRICDQATKTNPLMIIPVATFIDLFDKETKNDKENSLRFQILAKINQFFQRFLQKRHEKLKNEIIEIESRSIISAAFSERLKCLMSKFTTNIHIELCQSVSSVTFQGVAELHQTIGKCVLTHKNHFPNVDRIIPRLWADTNQYLESIADYLPVSYLSWDNFRHQLIEKDGLSNLVDEITLSLKDQGKILVLNELGTKEKVVFLRPLWLADLLSSIFSSEMANETKSTDDEGVFPTTFLRTLWHNFLHKDEYFSSLCCVLMRFLLFAYPKINPRQLRSLFHSNEIQFDEIVVPFYLPMIDIDDRNSTLNIFSSKSMTSVSICYRSSMFPFGLFHQYSVLLLFRTSIIYEEHANDFLFGHHDDRPLKFVVETDHQTYIRIHCGTNHPVEPFDQLWQLLLEFIHHLELLLDHLSPNHQVDRCVRCPKCSDYSFMGEWNTPKDLQNVKTKTCSTCSESIDVNFLIQPNETRRRNEEILRKIRQRNSTPMKKKL